MVNSTVISMVAQSVQKDSNGLTKSWSLGLPQVVVQPYQSLNSAVIRFQDFWQRSGISVPLKQEDKRSLERLLLQGGNGAEGTDRNRSPEVEEAIGFLLFSMLENLSENILTLGSINP